MPREEKINTLKAIIQECEEYQWQRKETLFEIIKDLEQDPCSDAISRQAVKAYKYHRMVYPNFEKYVDMLPPVNPQPKTGHWIKTSLTQVSGGDFKRGFKCSHCNYVIVTNDFNYCPNCGAKMQEIENGNK